MKSVTNYILRSYFKIIWKEQRNGVFEFHEVGASFLYVNYIQFSFLMKAKIIKEPDLLYFKDLQEN